VAAEAAGIGETTFYRWMTKGSKAKGGLFREFWESIKKSEALAEQNALENLQQAAGAENAWQAYGWYLERKFPQRWAKRERNYKEPEKLPEFIHIGVRAIPREPPDIVEIEIGEDNGPFPEPEPVGEQSDAME